MMRKGNETTTLHEDGFSFLPEIRNVVSSIDESSFQHNESSESDGIFVLAPSNSSDSSSIGFNTNSSGSNQEEIKLKKKKNTNTRKPSFKPQYMQGLRIFRTDIRRKYPQMYANVMNSQDSDLIYRFFTNFCSPDFSYERKRDEVTGINQFSSVIAPQPICGRSRFIQMIQTFYTSTILADLTIRISNPRVIITKDVPGSRIIMDDTSELTILYFVQRIPASEGVPSQMSKALPAPGFEIVDPTTNDRIFFTLLPTPFRIKLESEIIIRMNEAHLICGMDITQKY